MGRNNKGDFNSKSKEIHVKHGDKTYQTKTVVTGTKTEKSGTNGWIDGEIKVETTRTDVYSNGKHVGTAKILGSHAEINFNSNHNDSDKQSLNIGSEDNPTGTIDGSNDPYAPTWESVYGKNDDYDD